eukprot:c9342_g1_i1 orf=299-1777(-)
MGVKCQRHTLLVAAAFFAFIGCIAVPAKAGRIGFCYGRSADNLPSPSQVVQLLLNQSISLVRIFDSDLSVIQAFANTGIELVIAIPNNDLQNFQTEQQADQWVTTYLAPLFPATNITVITVGTEVVTGSPSVASLVVPAMMNLHTGLTKAGLAGQIRVTTTHSMGVVQSSFPPSSATFNDSFATDFISPVLEFLRSTGSFFMVNPYPFIAYNADPQGVALDYALFEPQQLVVDPNTNLLYASMFDAQLDAIYFALEAIGHKELNVVISETGWPTQGDTDELGADVQNAATYNNNLVMHILNDSGTPHRPRQPTDAYLFSLFDEDTKPGRGSERHWGVYNADGSRKYYLDLQRTASGAPQSFNGTGSTWCIALPGASNDSLATGLDWACGPGNADCGPIQAGQPCYQPDTYENHASYAYNSYYQRSGDNTAACNFSGTAMITTSNPSYGSCVFSSDSLSSNGTIIGSNPSATCHILPGSNLKSFAIALFLFAV